MVTTEYRQNEDYKIQGCNTLNGYATIANTPINDKKIKIKERLRQFLRIRPTMESLREKGIIRDENVFGCNLELLCAAEKSMIPKFVQQCVQAIEFKDLTADGIYRACGNLSNVQKLRFEINQDKYQCLWKEDDVHVLTGLLKMFFRDMKEPLFPCDRFECLMKFIGMSLFWGGKGRDGMVSWEGGTFFSEQFESTAIKSKSFYQLSIIDNSINNCFFLFPLWSDSNQKQRTKSELI